MGKKGFSELKYEFVSLCILCIPHRVQLDVTVQCNWTEGTY